jgi:fatty acid desaturase
MFEHAFCPAGRRIAVLAAPRVITTTSAWRHPGARQMGSAVMVTLLWILAVVLVIAGIFAIFRGQMLWGIVLIIVGLLVGPGGVSIFT